LLFDSGSRVAIAFSQRSGATDFAAGGRGRRDLTIACFVTLN
jgi:hypothetical protein